MTPGEKEAVDFLLNEETLKESPHEDEEGVKYLLIEIFNRSTILLPLGGIRRHSFIYGSRSDLHCCGIDSNKRYLCQKRRQRNR